MTQKTTTKFGIYGGQFVPEILMPAIEELTAGYEKYKTAIEELTAGYEKYKNDPEFTAELARYLADFAGRPTPLYHAKRLSKAYGVKIYIKREDLVHGGAHKLNNTIGQALLAKYMGKTRIIAETGAGQHGTAVAMAGANLGIETVVYMGSVDMKRQQMNVYRMQLLGAKVVPVESGSKTLKDAINETLRDWVATVENTYYIIGSVVGPYPYPVIVRDFQTVVGNEARDQIMRAEGRLPDSIVACVGGGSNAIGVFYPFIGDADVDLFAVEAGGSNLMVTEKTAYHRVASRRNVKDPAEQVRADPRIVLDCRGSRLCRRRS